MLVLLTFFTLYLDLFDLLELTYKKLGSLKKDNRQTRKRKTIPLLPVSKMLKKGSRHEHININYFFCSLLFITFPVFFSLCIAWKK